MNNTPIPIESCPNCKMMQEETARNIKEIEQLQAENNALNEKLTEVCNETDVTEDALHIEIKRLKEMAKVDSQLLKERDSEIRQLNRIIEIDD